MSDLKQDFSTVDYRLQRKQRGELKVLQEGYILFNIRDKSFGLTEEVRK